MLRHFAIAAVLCGLAGSAAAAEPQTVTVQLVRSIGQAAYYIAIDKGYFTDEGIKVESSDTRSALDTIAPLATGQLDVGIGSLNAGFFNAAHQGFDLRIVAAMGIQGPVMATRPLIRKALWDDGSIRSAKDYKGHKVAINAPGDITEYFLILMLKKYDMTVKDVDLVPLGFAEQVIGFKNGAIDAGFLPEPLGTTALMSGTVMLDQPDDSAAAGAITTFVYFGTKFMHDKPQTALAFLRALIRGAREAQGPYLHNPAIAGAIAKQTGLKIDAIERSVPYAIDPNLDIAKYEAGMREQEAVHRATGNLNYSGELQYDKMIDPSLVHQAAASLK